MSHELEFVGGRASYVGREPAWHGLGQVFEDLSYTQAMAEANLGGWLVQAEPLANVTPYNVAEQVDMQAITRIQPGTDGAREILSVMGGQYTAVQNEQAFALAEILTDEEGYRVVTAGSIRGGRQVFMVLESDRGFVIDPDGAGDRVQQYLALRTSHDGTLTVQAVPTLIRIVCANTFDAVNTDNLAYSIKHTDGVHASLAEAQAAIVAANSYMETFAGRAEDWFKTDLRNNDELKKFVAMAHPLPGEDDSDRKKTTWDNRFEAIVAEYEDEREEAIHGTVWGGFNAATSWVDHVKTVSGEEKNPENRLEAFLGMRGGNGWADKGKWVRAAQKYTQAVAA